MGMSLKDAKSVDDICKLQADNFHIKNWSIMTDGDSVFLYENKNGEVTSIGISKPIFDALIDLYTKKQDILP